MKHASVSKLHGVSIKLYCYVVITYVMHIEAINEALIFAQESMMELSRSLLDSLSQEGLSIKLTGKLAKPSPQQLAAFLHQFR